MEGTTIPRLEFENKRNGNKDVNGRKIRKENFIYMDTFLFPNYSYFINIGMILFPGMSSWGLLFYKINPDLLIHRRKVNLSSHSFRVSTLFLSTPTRSHTRREVPFIVLTTCPIVLFVFFIPPS